VKNKEITLMNKKLRDVGIALGTALAAMTAMYVFVVRPWQLRRGATDEEVNRDLPGDDLVPNSKHGYTQAMTIDAPPAKVWTWIVQTRGVVQPRRASPDDGYSWLGGE
jgi:hypothetical protein